MPGDFIADDLITMMLTDEFAIAATWTDTNTAETSVNGQFIESFIDIDPVTGETTNTDPEFVCAAADVSGVKQGETLTVSSVIYKIKRAIKDDTGAVMTLTLNKVV